MREVRLYGGLGEKFGKVHNFDVASPREAIQALCAVMPGFREHLFETREQYYQVLSGELELDEEYLEFPFPEKEVIKIVPLVHGAGGGGGILGGILLALSFFFPPFALALGPMMTGMVTKIGFALVMGGVASLLTDHNKPAANQVTDDNPNYSFSGAINTVQQGNPVPICYGELIVGSQVISGDITTTQVPPPPMDPPQPPEVTPPDPGWVYDYASP